MKVSETGTVQKITHSLVEEFLHKQSITAGASSESATSLYNEFLSYISTEGYKVSPNIRAFGRAMAKRLPSSKKRTGTFYFISRN